MADVDVISARFRAKRRAGVAVMLVFFRVSGRPRDRVSALPRALRQHVGEAIGGRAPTLAFLRSIYQRQPTHYEQQFWAKEYLGFKDAVKSTSFLLVAYR